jgi:hypothetical protein
MPSGLEPIAVFEILTADGPQYVIAATIPKGAYSEQIIAQYLDDVGMDAYFATRIYSERIPCPTCSGS